MTIRSRAFLYEQEWRVEVTDTGFNFVQIKASSYGHACALAKDLGLLLRFHTESKRIIEQKPDDDGCVVENMTDEEYEERFCSK